MNARVLALAAELIECGEPFVVATVVRREAPSSAQLGDTAIVTPDGQIRGHIGGSCTRSIVLQQALEVLSGGGARLISFRDDDRGRADDIVNVPMTCHSGGSVEIYIDPVYPPPTLLVLGSSPVTHAIARLGRAMGYVIHVMPSASGDEVPEDADELIEQGEEIAIRYGERQRGTKLFVLVASLGESDESMLANALAAGPDYLGVIASRRRMEEVRAELGRRGVAEAQIEKIHGPAGLDLGATRPEDVAVSVLAEIIAKTQSHAAGADAADDSVAAADERAATPETDPVCGMGVNVSDTTPSARHGDVSYYFCCEGCRDRFVADPARYASGAQLDALTDAKSEA